MTTELETISMVPIRDEESGHCMSECPYLKTWDHPYWHNTAWCWKQLKDLDFYDYWLADCIDNDPDPRLVGLESSGRTKAQ